MIVEYPITIPQPTSSGVKPGEGRAVSDLGPVFVRSISLDGFANQQTEWQFTNAEAEIFWTWWRDTLQAGGNWFIADWPHPDGTRPHAYRFASPPQQTHVPGEIRKISASLDVRGSQYGDDGDGAIVSTGLPTLTVGGVGSVLESAAYASWSVSLSPAAIDAVDVSLSVSGTATAGADYTATIQYSTTAGASWVTGSALTLTIGANGFLVRIPLLEDSAIEGAETITLTVTRTAGTTTNAAASGVVTIVDNELSAVSVADTTIGEAGGFAVFTLTISPAASVTAAVDYATADGTAIAGVDYLSRSGRVVFSAGQTSRTVRIPVLSDGVPSAAVTFTLNLSAPSGCTIADGVGVCTINAVEGAGAGTGGTAVLFQFDASPVQNTVFGTNATMSSGSLTSGGVSGTALTLSGTSGVWNQSILWPAASDTTDYSYGTPTGITVEGYYKIDTLGGSGQVALSVEANFGQRSDGNGVGTSAVIGQRAIITAQGPDAGHPNGQIVCVAYYDTEQYADEIWGFVAASFPPEFVGQWVHIAGVVSDGFVSLYINGIRLSNEEAYYPGPAWQLPAEYGGMNAVIRWVYSSASNVSLDSVRISLSEVYSGASFTPPTGALSIIPVTPGAGGIPTVSVADITVAESAGNAVFTITAGATSASTMIVGYTTADGSAFAGSDYTARTGVVAIAPGATTATVSVPILVDALTEGVETFGLTLSGVVGCTIADGSAVCTISASVGLPVLSINSLSVVETVGTAAFTVTLAPASPSAVTVAYATANGTATAASDYTSTSGTLTFAAGETSKTISVPVLTDALTEGDETFTVTLSSATNSVVGTAVGTCTILAAAAPPTVSAASMTVAESAGVAGVVVTLSTASASTVTVAYATADGTATAGSDYTAASGTLTFNPGETSKVVNVTLTNDTAVEGAETFTLTLSGPTGATLGAAVATITVTSEDVESGDSHFADVKLLLHANGTVGSATFTDSSSVGRSPSAVDGVSLITGGQFGEAIGKTSGATETQLFYAAHADFEMTGSWTLEFSLFVPAGIDTFNFMSVQADYIDLGGMTRFQWSGPLTATPGLSFYADGVSLLMSPGWGAGVWNRVAITQDATNLRAFTNGALVNSSSTRVTLAGNRAFNVCRISPSWAGPQMPSGVLIDEVRFTRFCRYTASYTPATAPFPDSA
jgi:hypothetical protein